MISELFLRTRYFATAVNGKNNPHGVSAAMMAFLILPLVSLKYSVDNDIAVCKRDQAATQEGERRNDRNTKNTVGCCRVDFFEFTSDQISTTKNAKYK
jgi:hypothetical protein